jgi:hypothetical protein
MAAQRTCAAPKGNWCCLTIQWISWTEISGCPQFCAPALFVLERFLYQIVCSGLNVYVARQFWSLAMLKSLKCS